MIFTDVNDIHMASDKPMCASPVLLKKSPWLTYDDRNAKCIYQWHDYIRVIYIRQVYNWCKQYIRADLEDIIYRSVGAQHIWLADLKDQRIRVRK